MSQNAVVKEVISPGVVRVSLMRQMQCGTDCHSCKVCISHPTEELLALADDPLGTSAGEWVELETNAGNSIAISLPVYLLPCITMLIGYMIGRSIGFGEGQSLLFALLGIAVGFLPAILLDKKIRKKDVPEFTISQRI
ncbi:MAG: SoxR reducing system RseC family protein [Eubacteriales bacterium]